MLFRIFFIGFCLVHSQLHSAIVITEVYANAPGRKSDKNKEWFEIHNSGKKPVELKDAFISRKDSLKLKTAWEIKILEDSFILQPNEYAVVAQTKDLGIEYHPEVPVIVIENKNYEFKNFGTQNLCIKVKYFKEHCVQFNDNAKFPDGTSRYFSPVQGKGFQDNLSACVLVPGIHATPGNKDNYCKNKEDRLLKKTTKDRDKSLTATPPDMPSCSSFSLGKDTPLFFVLLILMIFFRPNSNIFANKKRIKSVEF